MSAVAPERRSRRRFLLSGEGWPYLLVPFIPLAVALSVTETNPAVTFFASALGVIPTAALMGRATEELAERSGPGVGGLLNVTFGNAPELIIALFALGEGLHEVVKASLVGSVLGNILLVLGASMLVGGIRNSPRQVFDRVAASAQSSLLLLSVAAITLVAAFQLIEGGGLPSPTAERLDFGVGVERVSFALAVIMMLVYGAYLVFSLITHRDLFNPPENLASEEDAGSGAEPWTVRRSVLLLALAGVAVGVMSEILVGSVGAAAKSLGLSEFFIGAIVIAIVGNAAEHWVAVLVAAKDKMDLAVNIAIGSSAQIAIFVLPLLVLMSWLIGPGPMPLVFNGLEVVAIVVAVLIANQVTNEGESNWFEGLLLLAVYGVLGVTFAFA
ncbi:MAG: calcium/proton exchanger [Actinomycetota bacterium]|nr:calcium/proton exchanger [Actinomycetota bacterium]